MADGQSDFEKAGMKISSTNVYAGGSSSNVSSPAQPKEGQPTSIYQAGGVALGSADPKTGNRTIYDTNYNAVGTLTKGGEVLVGEGGQKYYEAYKKSGSKSETPQFQKEGGQGGRIVVIGANTQQEMQGQTPQQSMSVGTPTPRPEQPDYTKLDYSATTPERKQLLESTYGATASYLFNKDYSQLTPSEQATVKKTALEGEASYYRGAIKEEARVKIGRAHV